MIAVQKVKKDCCVNLKTEYSFGSEYIDIFAVYVYMRYMYICGIDYRRSKTRRPFRKQP